MDVKVGEVRVNFHEEGAGEPVLLLHGSGPGVSAMANWSRTMPAVAAMGYRAIAVDVVGFGDSDRPRDFSYNAEGWAQSIRDLMAALDIERTHLVGNSMGGRIALTLAARTPDLVSSLTLMGVRAPGDGATEGLRTVRGYEPSLDNMRRLLREHFVVDPSIVSEDLIADRFAASTRPGESEHYRWMFAQPGANDLPLTDSDLQSLQVPTLILHGREDRVIPVRATYRLLDLIPDVTAVIISNCGHWVQVEGAQAFESQLELFLRQTSASEPALSPGALPT